MEGTEPRDEPLSVKQFAALFRLTERAVYQAIREQRLSYPVERPLGPRSAVVIRVPADLVAKLRPA